MGRLIDETDLMNLLYGLDDARHGLPYAIEKIPELPEVEAIPKMDYEARLKADMVAMLKELKSYIELMAILETDPPFAEGEKYCTEIIQQKINELS